MGPNTERIDFPSRFLSGPAGCIIIHPSTDRAPQRGLILLHGAQESPETILENSAIPALSGELGLAVLLPDLDNSFCLDWGDGQDYRSFLLLELLPGVRRRFPVFAGRERCAIGGISMGGLAAVSLALSHPDAFSRVFSLSGALDPKKAGQICRILQAPAPCGLSGLSSRPEIQLCSLMERCDSHLRPEMYLAWGADDWFARANTVFAGQAAALGFSVRTEIRPGLHDWDYWRESLPGAVRWAAGSES